MYRTRDEAVPVNPPFEIVLRGFDRQQVIDHVEALKARVAAIGAERDAALRRAADLNEQFDNLRREAAEANAQAECQRQAATEASTQVDRLERSPLTAATARIQRMVQMAEEEAAELQASAEQESASLRESARAEADALLRETTQRCKLMEAESQRRCQTGESESAARCQRAELDSERRRLAAEQRSQHNIARRRAEAEAWVSDYQTRGAAALYLILQLVAQRWGNQAVEVRRQTTALRQLRAEITDQVCAVHRLLTEAVSLVDQPSTAEQHEHPDSVAPAQPMKAVESVEAGKSMKAGKSSNGSRRQSEQPTARFGLHP
ncbi:MAG: hypothetical protein ACRDS1_17875 [Pseudonocardiaceae bacterium]